MPRIRSRSLPLALVAVLFALNPMAASAQPVKKAVEPPATDPATMKVAKGFKVELLFSVPKDEMGSWVCMCVDPKGRLLVSDQYGGLYRVTPRGERPAETRIEKIPAQIGSAQGLVWAFDSLYVVVNAPGKSGMYRVTSSKKNDTLDTVETLRLFQDGGGRARPARGTEAPGRQAAHRRLWEPDQDHQVRHDEGAAGVGRGPPAAAPARRQRLHERRDGAGRGDLQRLARRQAVGTVQRRLPQPVRRRVPQERRPVHLRRRHGVGLQHPVVPADAGVSGHQRQRVRLAKRCGQVPGVLRGQPAAGHQRRPRLADRRVLRLRRQVPAEVPGRAVHLRLELRQAVRHALPPQRERVHGGTGGVRHRHPAPAHGRGGEPG